MANPHPNALVTGSARRIGAAIARDLGAHGFNVVVHYNRSRDEAESVAKAIRAAGGSAQTIAADLADPVATAALMAQAETAFGPISLLVNNASVFADDSATDFDLGAWDRHFAVHLKAPALLGRALAAALPAGTSGLVVNVIDQRVLRLTPRFFSYTLSKAALWTATQTMAQAFAPSLRVNAIGPGPAVANTRQTDQDFAAQIDGLLLKRGPALEEFGRTIRFLWETPSITGQMITIDGGQHLAWQTPDVTGMVE